MSPLAHKRDADFAIGELRTSRFGHQGCKVLPLKLLHPVQIQDKCPGSKKDLENRFPDEHRNGLSACHRASSGDLPPLQQDSAPATAL
jgi:hypothetical protein